MKKSALIFVLYIAGTTAILAQQTYISNGGELLFQFADVTDQGYSINNDMRFTLFFHTGNYFHVDFNQWMGIYTGTAIRNIGYIVEDGSTKIKRRAYSLGIPLAIKIGNMDRRTYLFAGGEYEWLFHYKEKIFENGNKTKYTEWFSPRVNTFLPSVFAGIQFKGGMNAKIKFYLDNFMNPDYRDNNGNYPYQNLKTELFYISLSWNIKMNSWKDIYSERHSSYAKL